MENFPLSARKHYDRACLNLNNSNKERPTAEIFIDAVQSYVLYKALASGARRVAPFLGEVPLKTRHFRWSFSCRAHVWSWITRNIGFRSPFFFQNLYGTTHRIRIFYDSLNALHHFLVRSPWKLEIEQNSQYFTTTCTKCARGGRIW